MTMMSALVGRRRPRDSEADVETEIYVRPQQQPMAWDRVMVLQIMKGLETRLPRVVPPPMRVVTPPAMRVRTPPPRAASPRVVLTRRPVPIVPPPDEPNVFLIPWTPADPPPPWAVAPAAPVEAAPAEAAPAEAPAAEETLVLDGRPRKVVVHKTKVPWLLFVMAFGIAFGVGQDRQLRRDLGTKLRVSTTHAAAVVARHVLPTP